MPLKEKLMEDLKESMKSKNKVRKDTITMVRAAIKQKEVDERIELTDAEIVDIIAKQVKNKKIRYLTFKRQSTGSCRSNQPRNQNTFRIFTASTVR